MAQIDVILQKHLVANPEFADHDIHLRQDTEGGLRIVVDDKSYSSPREIDNPQIQAVIKRALQELGTRIISEYLISSPSLVG